MLHKTFQLLSVKADDAEAGTFEALVSVFGNVDRGNDRVMPGAFTKSLERWRDSGDPIPIILSHLHTDPMAHIGVAQPHNVMETDKGLLVRGQLDVGDNPVADQVYRLMKRRSLKEFSFAYEIGKGGQKRGKDGVNELHEIDLIEAGPTLKGMNPSTELNAVKSIMVATQNEMDRTDDRAVDLRRVSDQLAADVAMGTVRAGSKRVKSTGQLEAEELRRASRDLIVSVMSGKEPA